MQYYFNNKFSLGNYVQKEFEMIPVDIVVELDDPINICCAYSDGMVGFEFTVEPAQLQFVVMDCLRVVTNDLSGITLGTDGHKQVVNVMRRGAILNYVPNLVEQVLGCGPQYEHKLLRIPNGHERYDYYGVRLKQTRKGIYKLLIMKL